MLLVSSPCRALGEPVTVCLSVLDHDDLRGALQPDARGRTERGDLAGAAPAGRIGMTRARRRRSVGRSLVPAAVRCRRRARRGAGCGMRRQLPRQPADDGDSRTAGRRSTSGTFASRRPDGGELALGSLRGRPLVLNFWATWCPPCVEEMPMLDRFQREQQRGGWQVVGLAVDSAAPVREFLARHPVGFPIGLAGMQGVELSRALGNTRGALPFSVVFDARGEAGRAQARRAELGRSDRVGGTHPLIRQSLASRRCRRIAVNCIQVR